MWAINRRWFAAFLTLAFIFSGLPVKAQEVSVITPTHCCDPVTGICTPANIDTNVNATTGSASAQAAANLDLSSTVQSILIPQSAQFAQVNIQVGDMARAIAPGAQVTPAEFIALQQALAGSGAQSLLLSQTGSAIGGSFAITSALNQAIGSLLVPQGVTAFHDFGVNSVLNIAGNLTNAGNFYAVSSNAAVDSATISAFNIMNMQGALLSSILPAGLTGYNSILNLNLIAVNNIVNAGTIMSAGNLTATAGGSIINALPSGMSGPSPIMQAMNNMNLQSASIINAGLMAATAGNINIAQQMVANVTVDNTNGIMQALAGQINVGSMLSINSPVKTALMHGDWLSKELNVFSGAGNAIIDVGALTGKVNVTAAELHLYAQTDTLTLGNICLTGDPIFANQGNIELLQLDLTTQGADLAVIAKRNITVGGDFLDSPIVLNTQGGSVLMVAGADFNYDSGSDTATIFGGSNEGGTIDLTTGAGVDTFTTRPAAAIGSGGDVNLIAFAGSDPDSGKVFLPSTLTITTGSQGAQADEVRKGDVLIIAGHVPAEGASFPNNVSIAVGNIDTSGAAGYGGVIRMTTATPMIADGPVQVTGGTITTGEFTSKTLSDPANISGARELLDTDGIQAGSIVAGNLTSNGLRVLFEPTPENGFDTVEDHYIGVIHAGSDVVMFGDILNNTPGVADPSGSQFHIQAGHSIQMGGATINSNSAFTKLFIATGDGGLNATGLLKAPNIVIDTNNGPNSNGSVQLNTVDTNTLYIEWGGDLTTAQNLSVHDLWLVSNSANSLGAVNNRFVTDVDLLTVDSDSSVYITNLNTLELQGSTVDTSNPNAILDIEVLNGDLGPTEIAGTFNGGTGDPVLSTLKLTVHGTGRILWPVPFFNKIVGNAILIAEDGDIGSAPQGTFATGPVNIVSGGTLQVQTNGSAYITIDDVLRERAPTTILQASVGDNATFQVETRHSIEFPIEFEGNFIFQEGDFHIIVGQDGQGGITGGVNSTINIVSDGKLTVAGQILAGTDSTIDLLADGNISLVNPTFAGRFTPSIQVSGFNSLVKIDSQNGSITVGNDVIAGFAGVGATVGGTINAEADQSITRSATAQIFDTGKFMASAVSLKATSGDIGSIPNLNVSESDGRVLVSASNLGVQAGGSVWIQVPQAFIITNASGGTVDILGGSNIFSSGAINVTNLVLKNTVGSITLNSLVTASQSIDLHAQNNIVNSGAASAMVAPAIKLVTDSGSIGTGPNADRLMLNAGSLQANSANDVFIIETDNVTIGASASSAVDVFDLQATGRITVGGDLSGGLVKLVSTNSSEGIVVNTLGTITGTVPFGSGAVVLSGAGISNQGKIVAEGPLGTISTSDNGNALIIGTLSGFQSWTAAGGIFFNAANKPISFTVGHPSFYGPVMIDAGGGTVTVAANVSLISDGMMDIVTPALVNGGAIFPLGALNISSPAGSGLTISGGGQLISRSVITAVATTGTLLFSGNQGFEGQTSLIATGTNGKVTINPNVTISVVDIPDGRLVISGVAGSDLLIDSGGALGTLSALNSIEISASSGQALHIQNGSLRLNSPAILSATGAGASVEIDGGGQIDHGSSLTINSPTFTNNGSLGTFGNASAEQVNTGGAAPDPTGAGFSIQTKTFSNQGTLLAQVALAAPQAPAASGPAAPEKQTFASQQTVLTFLTEGGSVTTTTVTNEQIGTKIATDSTQLGTNPALGQNSGNLSGSSSLLSQINPSSSASPELSGGSGGWTQESGGGEGEDSGDEIWTGGYDAGGEGGVQHAIKVMQKLAMLPSSVSSPISGSKNLLAQAQTGSGTSAQPAAAAPAGPKFINIPRGVALISAKNPMVIGTQEGTVHLEKGAKVFVIETGHDVAVYNLLDGHKGGVRILVGKKLIALKPGQQVLLTRKPNETFETINPVRTIAYRNTQSADVGEGVKAFTADFSMISAISSIPPLRKMVTSDKPSDRKMVAQLLKSAVIMADLAPAAGPYKTASK